MCGLMVIPWFEKERGCRFLKFAKDSLSSKTKTKEKEKEKRSIFPFNHSL